MRPGAVLLSVPGMDIGTWEKLVAEASRVSAWRIILASVFLSLFIAEDAKLRVLHHFPSVGQLIKDFNRICLISQLPLDLMVF